MAPTQAGFNPLLLLLLLGLWVAEVPVSAKPKNMTSAQWFETQHVQPNHQQCNTAMANINKYTKNCKNLNTFLHESFSEVATTCQTPTIACKNGRDNCHQSQKRMSSTRCDLTSGTYPNCKYKERQMDTFFIVACTGEMAPARTGFSPLLLLLLLGLWVAEVPVSAKPKNMTSAQWFETQHVQPNHQQCNTAMANINKYTKNCKNLNTFLHESFSEVATTCHTPKIACKNGRDNCHQSQKRMFLTQCQLTSGKYPDCRYKETQMNAFFIVACEAPQAKDDQSYQLVPVHLDKVI
ncbi:Ribonuclease 7 [Galemys pyrenaicus]|uniref:Ribonuclease 7 n=1 Tax=Galemys pyrenaicus TaxID=202257 RepID=A0A8J5ZZ93_GALPY|nr:Ribonuclease 7 [Galemys pyrenaicus]